MKLMIDIETLSLHRDAIVTDVCMLPFTSDGEIDENFDPFRAVLPANPQKEILGRDMNVGTILFWMDQPPEARAPWLRETLNGNIVHLNSLMNLMASRIRFWEPTEIWARGPQFDIVILENIFQGLDIQVPWKYNIVRDLRTLMAVAGLNTDDVEKQPDFIQHSALSDCVFQVRCYQKAMAILEGDE